jgi:hypothetical protein
MRGSVMEMGRCSLPMWRLCIMLAWIMGTLGWRNWLLGALELDPQNAGICIMLSKSKARLSLWDEI